MLAETAKIMELHNANEFKVRSFQNAAFAIGKLEAPLKEMSPEDMSLVKGIGKSLSQKIVELLNTGVLQELEEYMKDTPMGVVEMMRIKGIGPKKVAVLWKELGVESPGELLYACNENRLIELKGFGQKTQDQIRSAIEYANSQKGFFHYAALEKLAVEILKELNQTAPFFNSVLTGNIRRKCEVLTEIEILSEGELNQQTIDKLSALKIFSGFDFLQNEKGILYHNEEGIKIQFYFSGKEEFTKTLFLTTGNSEHLSKLQEIGNYSEFHKNSYTSELEIYNFLNLQFIEPELREGLHEVDLALKKEIPELINFTDLRGSLHNHSTYSDGIHSLKDMAVACKNLGYEYLGICDHSKSAFYANGLREDRILQQHQEIDQLNIELSPFRIFIGIESDILHDGSLDYDPAVLKQFDFIVASVHSGLKMNEDKATERLLKAIANPYTTILGHPTGRLLLARQGYPIDHKRIIDACAENNVVIELNAHPYRLDLDWRWIQYAIQKNVMISINPDAHKVEGYHDMYYGVCVARKGMLTKSMTFNALSGDDVNNYFITRKQNLLK